MRGGGFEPPKALSQQVLGLLRLATAASPRLSADKITRNLENVQLSNLVIAGDCFGRTACYLYYYKKLVIN